MDDKPQQRYQRQISLPEIGKAGQLKLSESSVLCVGAGGLGSASLLYLAAAGIGTIALIDDDKVELSNLQRQILYTEQDLGKFKVTEASKKLRALNSQIEIKIFKESLNPKNAKIVKDYDIIIDGTDNFETRYLCNDVAFFYQKPLIYAAIEGFKGQITVFDASQNTPCYRCLLPSAPSNVSNCSELGVLGILPGIIGTIQATEAIKYLLSLGNLIQHRMLVYDALAGETREVKISKDPNCKLCGSYPSISKLEEESVRKTCSHRSIVKSINAQELTLRFKNSVKSAFYCLDVREVEERQRDAIEPSAFIPLGELPNRLDELPKNQDIVIYCRSGIRSAKAIEYLQTRGLKNCFNLEGGIISWNQYLEEVL